MKDQGLIPAAHHWFSMNHTASWLSLSVWEVIAPIDSLNASTFSCPMRRNSRLSRTSGNGPAVAIREVRCQITCGTATQSSHALSALCHDGGRTTDDLRLDRERRNLAIPYRIVGALGREATRRALTLPRSSS